MLDPSLRQDVSPATLTSEIVSPLIENLAQRGEYLFRSPDGRVILRLDEVTRAFSTPQSLGERLVACGLFRFINPMTGAEIMPTGRMLSALGALVEVAALPTLKSSARLDCPYFDGASWLNMEPGYKHGVLFDGDARVWTKHDPEHKYPHLRTMFSGVNTDDQSKKLLQCLLCLMVGRAGLPEFPLIMIDAESKNSGKTRTAQGMRHVVSEEGTPPINDIRRLNQQSGGLAWKPGPTVLLFDNIGSKVFSEHLSSAVHDEHLTVEPKHLGLSKVFFPVMIFTLNQGKVEHDLGDKCVFIRLNRPETVPPEGAVIMDPDPERYAKQYRLRILDEVRHVLNESAPLELDEFTPQTRFVDWERCLRGVAKTLGYTPLQLRRDTDEVRDQLALDLLYAIDHHYDAARQKMQGEKDPTMGDLATIIRLFPKDYSEANHLMRGATSHRARSMRLRKKIDKMVGKRLTFEGSSVILTWSDDESPARIIMKEA